MKLTADLLSQLGNCEGYRPGGHARYVIQSNGLRVLVFWSRNNCVGVGIQNQGEDRYDYMERPIETVADLLVAVVDLSRKSLAEKVTDAMRQNGADFY